MRTYPWIVVPVIAAVALPWAACGGSTPGNTSTTSMGGHTTTTHTTTTTTTSLGSGGGAPATLAACDAPAAPPSKGACYKLPTHPPPASCTASPDAGTPDAGGSDAGGSDAGGSDAGGSDAGAFSCSTVISMPDACGMCIESSCCAELTACNAIANCIDCATDPNADPTTCMAQAITDAINAINTCQGTCCQDICSPPCNPVTNAGCDASNMEACDIDFTNGGYTCFVTTGGSDICMMCDEMNGPYCNADLTCLSDGNCGAYCCDDGDCGTGKCDKTQLPNNEATVGVCVHK